jgi:four helix bundle protein
MIPMTNFITYNVSLDLIRTLRPIVPAIKKHDRDLADQLRRAATSISLNLGEGRLRTGGDQRRHYEIAHGSAGEVLTALDVADAWGYVIDAGNALATLDRLLALMWRLTRGRAQLTDNRDATEVTARLALEATRRGQA